MKSPEYKLRVITERIHRPIPTVERAVYAAKSTRKTEIVVQIPSEGTASFAAAGAMIRKIRTDNGIKLEDIAGAQGDPGSIDISALSKTERGVAQPAMATVTHYVRNLCATAPDDPLLLKVIREAIDYVDARKEGGEEARNQLLRIFHEVLQRESEEMHEDHSQKQESQDWLHTINVLPFEDALSLLVHSELLNTQDAALESGTDKLSIRPYALGEKTPHPSILKKLISASPIDEEGHAAQLLQLKRADMFPLSIDDILACSLGQFARYGRNTQGFSQRDMQEPLDRKQYVIRKIENDKPTQDMEEIPERLITFLSIDPDGVLADVIRSKAGNEQIIWLPPEDRQLILEEGLLLAEHITALPEYVVSESEQEFIDTLEDKHPPTTGSAFKGFRELQGVNQRKEADIIGTHKETISEIERDKTRPSEQTAIRIARAFHYSIHHPVTHALARSAKYNQLRADTI